MVVCVVTKVCRVTYCFCRPPVLTHDHCYLSGLSAGGEKKEEKGNEQKKEMSVREDGRRCVICPVLGDADTMVSREGLNVLLQMAIASILC